MILNVILILSIIILLLVIWSIHRNYKMLNQIFNNILEQSATLGEKVDAQETKLQGSYAMSEALCRRISTLSKDIDGQTKLLSAMVAALIPNEKRDAFFQSMDEYEDILKEYQEKTIKYYQNKYKKNTQSPPPPTADENDSQLQDSNNSDTNS